MDRTRSRWIRFGAVALFAGIVFNVLVAWGVALIGLPGRTALNYDAPGQGWPRRPPAGWPHEPDTWSTGDGTGYSARDASQNMAELARTRRNDPTIVAHMMIVESYGLPWRSMRTTRRIIQQGRTITEDDQSVLERGLLVPKLLNRHQFATNRIAFEPVWPGFLLDSLLYAVLAAALRLGFGRLRARRRRRRDRCVHCNYDLAGLGICPECGAPVRGGLDSTA